MRRTALVLACLAAACPALADEGLPQGPKAPPPEPLPEAACDTAKPDSGDWLLGRWVAPYAKWEFKREPKGLVWHLEQKPDINRSLGWKDGASLDGAVETVSACTLRLVAGDNGDVAFAFDAVRTDENKIYGYAVNKAGQQLRWVLRRER
ncbi:MAG: hypothetical protein HY055_16910 [Magnetospirillum sp.]|nr:hypothetical protein [Magnetospirillum sp.]